MTNLLQPGRANPSTVTAPPSPAGRASWWGRVRTFRHLDAVVIGLVAAAASFAFMGVPSVWYDEAATVTSATRSWGELWRLIQSVDIVHATYYAFMHVWFDVFPYSPISLRMPSVFATGIAAALVVVLGKVLVNRRTGVVAGLLFCMIPRVTWMGSEGRSYSISALLAVATTLVLVTALRRSSRRWWVAYAVFSVLSVAVFLYLALVIIGHGVTLLLLARRAQRLDRETEGGAGESVATARRSLIAWFVGAAVAAVASLPISVGSMLQTGQVGWIPKPSFATINQVLVTQWFYQNSPFALFGWLLVAAGIVVSVLVTRRLGADRPASQPSVLAVALPWMIVPTVGLVLESVVATPLYSPRYLTFGTPAVALVMGAGLAAVRWRSLIALVLIGGVALSAPGYVEQREPEAKDSSAWNQVADLIATQRAAEPEGTTEGVVYGPVRRHPKATSRIIAEMYPAPFQGMSDFTLLKTGAENNTLWETQASLESTISATDSLDVVYLITSNKQDWRPRVTADLTARGFHLDHEWKLTRTNVLKFTR
ncbi:glycosyltransferase family 39 protein [Frigoribacterium sp. 2-23]|uniref:glycosyltransferase family 39 protein n=1 Tax=Frigoribacterium sp. 2-23 TaxID=3415006 RepID=UPI003C700BA3